MDNNTVKHCASSISCFYGANLERERRLAGPGNNPALGTWPLPSPGTRVPHHICHIYFLLSFLTSSLFVAFIIKITEFLYAIYILILYALHNLFEYYNHLNILYSNSSISKRYFTISFLFWSSRREEWRVSTPPLTTIIFVYVMFHLPLHFFFFFFLLGGEGGDRWGEASRVQVAATDLTYTPENSP